jgi:hypothetical protein
VDELLASDIKIGSAAKRSYVFEDFDETETLKVKQNHVICPSISVCFEWALFYKNVSLMIPDTLAELSYAIDRFFGENSKRLMCRLEDGVVERIGRKMVMFPGDPLMKRVNEIIDRVVEAGLFNFWMSQPIQWVKVEGQKIAIIQPLDEYYSFNLYHIQPAFYLLLMGWCLSALFFMVEVMYKRLLSKILECL